MEYYEVEVDCMQYCYGGSAKFTVDPNGYGEWAKRADVELLITQRDRLAAENAELRGKLDDVRMGIGCARGQRSTQFCAEAAAKDAVIAEMLAMLEPKGRDPEDEDRISDFASTIHDTYNGYDGDQAQMKKFRDDTQEALRSSVSELLSQLHARAVAIAEGRDNG